MKRYWPVVLGLLLAGHTLGQADETPLYFSLDSHRTVAPGETAIVGVWSDGVGSLEFRVYRVEDEEKFFTLLEDPHQFGGSVPGLAKERTWLERFRGWKARTRYSIKSAFKQQFSHETRVWMRPDDGRGPVRRRLNEASFAQVPLLNSKQLVTRFKQPMKKQNQYDQVNVPLKLERAGVYLVEATNGDLRAYTVVSVTNHVMVTKGSPGKLVAFVVDRQTGAPAAGAEVAARMGSELKRAKADASGIATLALGDFESRGDDVLTWAKLPGSFVVGAVPGYGFNASGRGAVTGYVYSERPVYRPGHKVHFRGILRTPTKEGYALPDAGTVRAEITDAEGKTVLRQTLALSKYGSVNGDFELPAGAALGQYAIDLRMGDAIASGNFEVQEYKKPEYQVKVTALEKRYLQGRPIEADIEARYFFGEPVKGAAVKYRVMRYRYWAPWYERDEDSEDSETAGRDWGGEEIASDLRGTLDDEGKLRVKIDNPVGKNDYLYRIEVGVTDAAGREIEGTGYAVANYGSYMVGISTDNYVQVPGQPMRFAIVARYYDGRPVASARYRVEVRDYHWDQGKRFVDRVVTSGEGSTSVEGKGSLELTAPKAGAYLATVISRTPEGRDVSEELWLWVYGGASDQFSYRRDENSIQIVPDKKKYSPGETARLLIMAGMKDAHLLVSVEGRDLHSVRHVHARQGTATIDVPVRESFAPNFWVQVSAIKNGQSYQGMKMVKVPPVERQIQLTAKASKAEFKPGERVTYALEAKDWQGKPVAAEVSLGVVDEAIYSVRPETMPEISKVFYGSVYSVVSTENSLSYFFHGEAGKRSMMLAARRMYSAPLGQLKQALVQPKVRKLFPDTAYWSPAVVTGADGRASVSFDFPDALTTWRATARGVTEDTRVGSVVDRVIVRKNLILRTGFPRFFTEGDEVVLKLVVQNYLASEKKARVSLAAKGLEFLDGDMREVTVAPKGEAVAEFRVKAGKPGDVVLTGQALTDEESDALEVTLPVRPFGVLLSQGRAGEGNADFRLAAPASMVEISVTPSVAGAVFGGLDYLSSFPYGCVEQTMSSFMPNVIVARTLADLKLSSAQKPAELDAKIKAGVDRLISFQHPDGGWGWWQTDDSHPFMTALVVEGFARLAEAGRGTGETEEARKRGAEWLRGALTREADAAADLRVYITYALVLHDKVNTGLLSRVDRSRLSVAGKAYYGLAALKAGDRTMAESLAAQIQADAKSNDAEVWWEADRDGMMGYFYDMSPQHTAMAVKLLAKVNPKNALLPKAARWLMGRRAGGYWLSTRQTADAIDGLTEFLRASGELKPDGRVRMEVDGKTVFERAFTEADALAVTAPSVRLNAPANARIRVTKEGTGRVYWTARADWYSAEERLEKKGTMELSLLRDYFRLTPVKKDDRIVYRLEPLDGQVNAGDIIASRLTLTGSPWRYLMIEDPIPAGLELIQKDQLYELETRPDWWGWWYTRKELRDDRAALFITNFSNTQQRFTHLMKVTNTGRFRASAARVQPMYQPEYQATTEAKTFEVVKPQ